MRKRKPFNTDYLYDTCRCGSRKRKTSLTCWDCRVKEGRWKNEVTPAAKGTFNEDLSNRMLRMPIIVEVAA